MEGSGVWLKHLDFRHPLGRPGWNARITGSLTFPCALVFQTDKNEQLNQDPKAGAGTVLYHTNPPLAVSASHMDGGSRPSCSIPHIAFYLWSEKATEDCSSPETHWGDPEILISWLWTSPVLAVMAILGSEPVNGPLCVSPFLCKNLPFIQK